MAATCALSALPVIGSMVASGLKVGLKASKAALKAGKIIKQTTRLISHSAQVTMSAIDSYYAAKDFKQARANGESGALEGLQLGLSMVGAVFSAGGAVSSGRRLADTLYEGQSVKKAVDQVTRGVSSTVTETAFATNKGKKVAGGGSNARLNTYGDALRGKLGPAYMSHPEEYNTILNKAKELGVTVEFREGTLAYDMEFGKAGKLIIDPEASIGALRHEYRHMMDDFSLEHPGMRIIADSNMFWKLEFRGYLEELNLARQIRTYDAGRAIINEMRQRRMEILGK